MTELAERLHIIRAHLQTGALGQREVWEEWLTEAADENARLQNLILGACDIFCQLDAPHWAAEFHRALEAKAHEHD